MRRRPELLINKKPLCSAPGTAADSRQSSSYQVNERLRTGGRGAPPRPGAPPFSGGPPPRQAPWPRSGISGGLPDPPVEPTRHSLSSVVAPVEQSERQDRKRPAEGALLEERADVKRRNKRLFGAILGTLQRFRCASPAEREQVADGVPTRVSDSSRHCPALCWPPCFAPLPGQSAFCVLAFPHLQSLSRDEEQARSTAAAQRRADLERRAEERKAAEEERLRQEARAQQRQLRWLA